MQYVILGAFASWFSCFSGIPEYIKGVLMNFGIHKEYYGTKLPIRLLPFDCEKCLGFWLGLTYSLYQGQIFTSIIYAGVCSLISIATTKLLNL